MTTSANGDSPRLLDQVRELIRIRHYKQILIRDAKGQKDRVTVLREPDGLRPAVAPGKCTEPA